MSMVISGRYIQQMEKLEQEQVERNCRALYQHNPSDLEVDGQGNLVVRGILRYCCRDRHQEKRVADVVLDTLGHLNRQMGGTTPVCFFVSEKGLFRDPALVTYRALAKKVQDCPFFERSRSLQIAAHTVVTKYESLHFDLVGAKGLGKILRLELVKRLLKNVWANAKGEWNHRRKIMHLQLCRDELNVKLNLQLYDRKLYHLMPELVEIKLTE